MEDLDARAGRGDARGPAAAAALRPRRLQGLQRRLRAPGRRRAAGAARDAPAGRRGQGRGVAYRMGGDEFCVLARLGVGRRGAARRARAEAALRRAGRGLRHHRLARLRAAPDGRQRHRRRRCARPTSASTPRKGSRPHLGRPPGDGRPAQRARRAQPGPRRAPARRDRPLRDASPTVLGAAGGGAAGRCSRPPPCTTSARSAIPDAILEQARRTRRRRVGVHAHAHAHRRADPQLRAGADPGGEARPLAATSAGTATGYPDATDGLDDPARAHASSPSATPTTR